MLVVIQAQVFEGMPYKLTNSDCPVQRAHIYPCRKVLFLSLFGFK